MCGIVGAVAQRDVQGILLEGLKRLEYRGYDSAGLAVLDDRGVIQRQREVGKVAALEEAITDNPPKGHMGGLPIRAGRPTANPPPRTPIPICPGIGSRWCTMASSRTSRP